MNVTMKDDIEHLVFHDNTGTVHCVSAPLGSRPCSSGETAAEAEMAAQHHIPGLAGVDG